MAFGPITSWKIDRETLETMTSFIFLGSKITADGNCSHEIKRWLLLGRKAMTNLDCVFKSRDITLPTKFCLAKAMVFPVVMYGCESWTIKKVEHQRIDAFGVCWRRLLKSLGLHGDPTSPSKRKSVVNIHWKDWCWNCDTLATWCEELTHLEKTPMLRKVEGGRKRGRSTENEMVGWHHWLDGHEFEQAPGFGDGQGSLACCSPWFTKCKTRLSDWTNTYLSNINYSFIFSSKYSQ